MKLLEKEVERFLNKENEKLDKRTRLKSITSINKKS